MRVLLGWVVVLMLAGCGDSEQKAPISAPEEVVSPAVPTPAPKPAPVPVRIWADLNEAITETVPEMSDIQGDELNIGAAKLAIWGVDKMSWEEIQALPTTKHGLVMKDSEEQRGKKLCASGRVIEIALERSIPGKKFYMGGMFDDSGRLYRFFAVKSTGEIMANSRARLCGVVGGQQHYPNSAGGIAHAVLLVGMFDLAENKNPPKK